MFKRRADFNQIKSLSEDETSKARNWRRFLDEIEINSGEYKEEISKKFGEIN